MILGDGVSGSFSTAPFPVQLHGIYGRCNREDIEGSQDFHSHSHSEMVCHEARKRSKDKAADSCGRGDHSGGGGSSFPCKRQHHVETAGVDCAAGKAQRNAQEEDNYAVVHQRQDDCDGGNGHKRSDEDLSRLVSEVSHKYSGWDHHSPEHRQGVAAET